MMFMWAYLCLHTSSTMHNFVRCTSYGPSFQNLYRNTIVGSSLGERIFIYFEKIRFASQKTKFLNFCFVADHQ